VKGWLLDENLPHRLRFHLSGVVSHSRDIGVGLSDAELWEYARINDLVIVSKDADFSERILISKPPPRVIHLRVGNLRRAELHLFLEQIWPRVEALLASNKLINVYRDHFETFS
jgi:predicted nuclease of predicted toxin-antitoxin system